MDAHRSHTVPAPPQHSTARDSSFNFKSVLIVIAIAIAVATMVLTSTSTGSISIVHQVPEGHIGVYWRGGALLKTSTDPGFHLKLPLITQFQPIQMTLQTDLVRNIPCGTKGGVMISFEKIEIEEVLKEALQADCRDYAPGIEILSVRVTKPVIPNSIRRTFKQMEEERIKVLVAEEQQRMTEKVAETVKKMAVSEAQKNAHVSMIQMEQKLAEQNSIRKQEDIRNEIFLAKEKSIANADFFRMIREAEAIKRKLTPQFLELKFIEAIANNSKIFFGNKVPGMVFDQRLLGNFFQDVPN